MTVFPKKIIYYHDQLKSEAACYTAHVTYQVSMQMRLYC